MGAEQSQEEHERGGYHVLKVRAGSPSDEAGLQPYFDWIVGVNGCALTEDGPLLLDMLRANVNQSVSLTVFSAKARALRTASIVPNVDWGGDGLVGCSVRFCRPPVGLYHAIGSSSSGDHLLSVWHVVNVVPASPAAQAGLQSGSDYIIGTPATILRGQNSFYEWIERNTGRPVPVFVYNALSDQCRQISLTPAKGWGGNDLLGCSLGFGPDHQIPVRDVPERPDTDASLSKLSLNLSRSELNNVSPQSEKNNIVVENVKNDENEQENHVPA